MYWKKKKKEKENKSLLSKTVSRKKASSQIDLFNPELHSTVSQINKRFGKDIIHFGVQKQKNNFDDLISSNDLDLLHSESSKLLKFYQELDLKCTKLSEAKKTNANLFKLRQLRKRKDVIRSQYARIKKRISQLNKLLKIDKNI